MSYFNSDQHDYMASLDRLEMTDRCWCGWNRIGDCHGCNERHPGKSRADYLAIACPLCFTLPPNHIKGCKGSHTTTATEPE